MPRWNTTTDEERFLAKVRKEPNGCWTWLAANIQGYGVFSIGPPWRPVRAHRWAYQHWVEPLLAGEPLHHECENPPCVNPAHLTPKTTSTHGPLHRELRKTCKRGHEWTPKNTHIDRRGNRHCRECQNFRARESRRRSALTNTRAVQNAKKTHCKRGHAFTDENTIRTNSGGRTCRACRDAANRSHYEAHREDGRRRGEERRRAAGVPLANARKTHCKYGHPFDEMNTYVYAAGRRCRTCDRLRHAGKL